MVMSRYIQLVRLRQNERTQCHKTIINFEPSIKGIAYNQSCVLPDCLNSKHGQADRAPLWVAAQVTVCRYTGTTIQYFLSCPQDHNNAGGNLSISLLGDLREENRLIYFLTERATRGLVFSSKARHFCLSYVLANKTDIKSAAYTQKLTNKHLL